MFLAFKEMRRARLKFSLLAAAVTASGHLRLSCVAVWLAYVLGASNLSPRPQTLAYPLDRSLNSRSSSSSRDSCRV